MIGRQCDTPAPSTYCAGLQFFTYEAELARIEEKVGLVDLLCSDYPSV